MPGIQVAPLPSEALLARYRASGDYTDCYAVSVPRPTSLAEFMAAFYTTRIFKLERWLIARLLGLPSSEQDATRLAQGQAGRFSAWRVEARASNQALLAAGRTRSWLMVEPSATSAGATTLYFGSAVVRRRRGGLGWTFTALLGFHRLYSRMLLGAAARRLNGGPA